MTVFNIARNYIKNLKKEIKKLPREEQKFALDIFVEGMEDTEEGGYYENKIRLNDKYKLFYIRGNYVINQFGPLEIDSARKTINEEIGKLRKKISRKEGCVERFLRQHYEMFRRVK